MNLQENVNPDLIMSMTQGVPSQLTGTQGRKDQVQDAIPKIAPKWLKYDRQVSSSSLIEADRWIDKLRDKAPYLIQLYFIFLYLN